MAECNSQLDILDPRLYTIAWLAPLEIEAQAALNMLDNKHPGRFPMRRGDDYVFHPGDICGHNIIIATFPVGQEYGTGSAAALASQVKRFFPTLWFGLLVGVAAGLPNFVRVPPRDIRLGDVLVALRVDEKEAIIAYDLGKETGRDGFQPLRRGHWLANTEKVVRSAIGKIKLEAPNDVKIFLPFYESIKEREHPGGTFVDPGQDKDALYQLGEDGVERQVNRDPRPASNRTRVWYGSIGSGEKLVKDAQIRDKLRDKYDIIGLEMEAAGTMNHIPVGVIRGVCDYADERKNKEWQPYAAAMAAAYAKAVLGKIGSTHVVRKSEAIVEEGPQPREKPADPIRQGKVKEILQRLYTLPYRDRKDRNPNRVRGTCDWFVSHKLFREWQKSKSSRMLWVSADPGCGKSVLAKYLVDFILPTKNTRTTCYFFFKDIDGQRSMVSALCCILRQVFEQKRILLSDIILDQFDINGELTSSFGELWHTLLNAARDKYAGEIICVLDAIDECEDQGRSRLAQALCDLYGPESTAEGFNLKFLLTSRPYSGIRRAFQPLDFPGSPVVHLSGENDVEIYKISLEIDIFIKARVGNIGAKLKLTPHEQDTLLQQLMRVPNRTYLWVSLTLDLIERDLDRGKMRIMEATSKLPDDVGEAYNTILSKSRDPRKAKKVLNIIVAAARPLTLREMNLALAIRKNHRSYSEIDIKSEDRFHEMLRDICGLFVTIINSKIYLLHETARDFLIQNNQVDLSQGIHVGFEWRYSLSPRESHRTLAEICVRYLLLKEFETHPLQESESISQYLDNHTFLDYSAKYWATHLRETQIEAQQAMVEPVLRICDGDSRRCLTWFRVYWTGTNTEFPCGFTTLMIASYFGLEIAVKRLLTMNGIVTNARDETYGRSALSWATESGSDTVVKLLIKGAGVGLLGWKLPFRKRPEINLVDRCGRTALTYAIWSGDTAMVKSLMNAGARCDLKDEAGGAALTYAACNRNKEMVKLLTNEEIEVDFEELLFAAVEKGDETVLRLLIEAGAYREAKNNIGETPLHRAALGGHEGVVKLLIEAGADKEAKACGGTPLHRAVLGGHEAIVRLLIGAGADNEVKYYSGTPLHWAAFGGHRAIVRLLIEAGADKEVKSYIDERPLHWAAYKGHEAAMRLLIEAGADRKAKDYLGKTPLHRAAYEGHGNVVRLLG